MRSSTSDANYIDTPTKRYSGMTVRFAFAVAAFRARNLGDWWGTAVGDAESAAIGKMQDISQGTWKNGRAWAIIWQQ
jgi:hypothetical protein